MSDLFHDAVPADFIAEVFHVMRMAHWHTFQVLTKRPERAAHLDLSWPSNVWMGTSIENQRFADRVDKLRAVQASVRFLSCEPLLGPLIVDLTGIDWVIVGGESGSGARPMRADWARNLRTQCLESGTAFFFKQWGAHNEAGIRVGKKKAGRLLDGRTWDDLPSAPSAAL
jgi:protein gp37